MCKKTNEFKLNFKSCFSPGGHFKDIIGIILKAIYESNLEVSNKVHS